MAREKKNAHKVEMTEGKRNIIQMFLQDIVLSGESSDIFLRYFKACLEQLFTDYETSSFGAIPKDFVVNHYVSSFAEAVKWWTGKDMETSPEKVVEYYMALTK